MGGIRERVRNILEFLIIFRYKYARIKDGWECDRESQKKRVYLRVR